MNFNTFLDACKYANTSLVIEGIHEGHARSTDENGETPLIWAVRKQHHDVVDLLLSESDPKHATHQGITALITAAKTVKPSMVKKLLPFSDASHQSATGWTALTWAIANDHKGMIDMLLPLTNLTLVSDNGYSALHGAVGWAKVKPNLDVIEKLLPGSDLDQVNKAGQTVLDMARANDQADVVDLLVKYERQLLLSMAGPEPTLAKPMRKRL